MFFEVELLRDVAVPAKSLDGNELRSIDREQGTVNESRVVFFPVTILCRTFLSVKGEILHGVIYATFTFGVILRCGRVVLEKSKKKYLVFGRVEGESLGPVSLSGQAGTDDINL
ncbi:hypothetical protein WN944_025894 [Citrus x changshan-huyou]|uniref:Uncharacterized protein n=1 Tax=Citrus x changshan-huyou TaxID=2935761 RepID=A0AAP0QBX4_9ROSI